MSETPTKVDSLDIELIRSIRSKLKQLNTLHSFTIYVLAAILASSVYDELSGLVAILPQVSISIIVILVMILTVIGTVVSRMLMKEIDTGVSQYETRLKGILRVAKDISEQPTTEGIFGKVLEAAAHLTASRAGVILMVEQGQLVIKSAYGKGIDAMVVGMSVPKDTGLSGWVAENSNPMSVDDVQGMPGFNSSIDWISDYKTHTALAVPLVSSGQTIGVIELLNRRTGLFDDKDREIAMYLATHVSATIDRANATKNFKDFEDSVTDILVRAIDNLAPGMRNHSRSVARFAMAAGREFMLSPEELERLQTAALLHDIGYLRAGFGIGAEAGAHRAHVTVGAEMLGEISQYRDVSQIVLHHHERFDGKGFPGGLEGADIPLEARILAAAETLDETLSAMSKNGKPDIKVALEALEQKAYAELDPSVVDAFKRLGDKLMEK